MARIRAKIENKSTGWTADIRPRVGSTTDYSGYYWSNITGVNSEPGVGSDWVRSGPSQEPNGLIRIAGYTGYLTDKRGTGNRNKVEAGNFLQGEGQFFSGEYVILYALIDDPLVEADVSPIHRYFLPPLT